MWAGEIEMEKGDKEKGEVKSSFSISAEHTRRQSMYARSLVGQLFPHLSLPEFKTRRNKCPMFNPSSLCFVIYEAVFMERTMSLC